MRNKKFKKFKKCVAKVKVFKKFGPVLKKFKNRIKKCGYNGTSVKMKMMMRCAKMKMTWSEYAATNP
jgi:hypothetical protein